MPPIAKIFQASGNSGVSINRFPRRDLEACRSARDQQPVHAGLP